MTQSPAVDRPTIGGAHAISAAAASTTSAAVVAAHRPTRRTPSALSLGRSAPDTRVLPAHRPWSCQARILRAMMAHHVRQAAGGSCLRPTASWTRATAEGTGVRDV